MLRHPYWESLTILEGFGGFCPISLPVGLWSGSIDRQGRLALFLPPFSYDELLLERGGLARGFFRACSLGLLPYFLSAVLTVCQLIVCHVVVGTPHQVCVTSLLTRAAVSRLVVADVVGPCRLIGRAKGGGVEVFVVGGEPDPARLKTLSSLDAARPVPGQLGLQTGL